MKKITCKELGGACDMVFSGEHFSDVAAQSQAHGKEMFAAQDAAHLAAMEEMKSLMSSPKAMQEWMREKEAYFNALPDE